jgi:tetratricopeptide (TPR) repeat protein
MSLRRTAGWAVAAAVFVVAGEYYLGIHHYRAYHIEREAALSLERSFPALERHLKRAITFSRNPRFMKELGRLYLEMGLAENEFGTAAGRDHFCDRAQEALEDAIRADPADGSAFYEMGKVYLLYNFPLLTYAEKGRAYLRRALELRPGDKFLNLNIVYIFLTQWDRLDEEEREFAGRRLREQAEADGGFMERLRWRWKENFGTAEGLERILNYGDT